MSSQSAAGKRAWKRRAGAYAEELREHVEQQSTARFAGWQARGRQPAWFRIKRALSRAGG